MHHEQMRMCSVCVCIQSIVVGKLVYSQIGLCLCLFFLACTERRAEAMPSIDTLIYIFILISLRTQIENFKFTCRAHSNSYELIPCIFDVSWSANLFRIHIANIHFAFRCRIFRERSIMVFGKSNDVNKTLLLIFYKRKILSFELDI